MPESQQNSHEDSDVFGLTIYQPIFTNGQGEQKFLLLVILNRIEELAWC